MVRALEIGLSFVLALAAPAVASAHEGHAHKVMGIVTAVGADEIEIATSDGREVSLVVNEQTRYRAGDSPAVAAEVKVGERAVVITEEKDGRVLAREVLLPPATQGESRASDRFAAEEERALARGATPRPSIPMHRSR
jgi:hypothetical protein